MPKEIKTRDKVLSWWLRKWGPEFLQEIIHTREEARACETFPTDQILDFFEMINSNLAVYLMIEFKDEPGGLVRRIAEYVNADKYKITPEELQRRIKEREAKRLEAKNKPDNKNKKKDNGKK